MKKIYITPKILAVELDTKQTILQACMVNGLYLWTGGGGHTHCADNNRGGIMGPNCALTPKGGAGAGTPMTYTLTANQTEANFPS